jgi:predicted nuclease of restriction endonuclease-like RecB superfamily
MLTGNLLRVRQSRGRIVPLYLDPSDRGWLDVAEQLLDLHRGREGCTRGELEQEVAELFGDDPRQLVHRGLARLVVDRCEFEMASERSPEEIRAAVFLESAAYRRERDQPFVRAAVVEQAAVNLGMSPTDVEAGLFADLKSEQRLVCFRDTTPRRLLERYNVALAQAVLLRSTAVAIEVRGETPARQRALLREAKFRRLTVEVSKTTTKTFRFRFDGPLSLFSATQKYGLQLALFLPAVLLCRQFDLEADLLWGPQRQPRRFLLSHEDRLTSHLPDRGTYIPPELAMFVTLFRKNISDWEISEESDVFTLPQGAGIWIPDYRLTEKATGKTVYLDVMGFWRRGGLETHLERLARWAPAPFVLAVSESLHVAEEGLEGLPHHVHRFRQMPIPDEVVRLARMASLDWEGGAIRLP